ncbi:hypothetical protein QSJ19_24380 [Gordonia sp. ABSL11-1]|uniref:hypothetical protein n=1 Tax=Gordonia sp. ABSL11-1 TaxID=3053924 RepID=UPI002572544F|nr:hypothetical protein [Gordonia sp. ABSL11-1]MDL9948665.1 hypothetical protein [Gordonia sp. ABSL11-1]
MTAAAPSTGIVAGEIIRYQGQFTPHFILTHIKSTVTITDRRVIVHHPHLLFGFIRHGYIQHEAPLRHVSQISTGNATSTRRIVYGVAALFVALWALAAGGAYSPALGVLVGLLFLGIAVVMFLTANTTGIFFHSTGGGRLTAAGARSELPEIQRAANEIGQILFS